MTTPGTPGRTSGERRPVVSLGRFDRLRAWVVTGAPGRGFAFTLDFAAAARTIWKARRR